MDIEGCSIRFLWQAPTMVAHIFQAPQLPLLAEMPTAFGAVLQRVSASMMAPSGLFGRGNDWREGATLVTGPKLRIFPCGFENLLLYERFESLKLWDFSEI